MVAFVLMQQKKSEIFIFNMCAQWLMTYILFRFQLHTTEAAKLEAEVTKAQKTITAAEQLISQLDGEHTRWNSQVDMTEYFFLCTFTPFLCLN